MAISVRGRSSAQSTSGANVSSFTIAYPAGVVANDFLMVWVTAATSGNTTISDPAGWTVEFETDTGTTAADNQSQFMYLKATGSLSGSLSVSLGGSAAGFVASMLVLTGVDTTTPWIAKSANTSTASAAAITTNAVVNTDATAYMVNWASSTIANTTASTWNAPSTTNAAGITEQQDLALNNAGNTNSINVELNETANAAATSTTCTCTLSKTTADKQAFLGFVKPAAPPATNANAVTATVAATANDATVTAVNGLLHTLNIQQSVNRGAMF